jgi:outer membrane protein assembly factor BamB
MPIALRLTKTVNYLISFYNNGQIWKINATSGDVLWKFGKNGDFEIPANAVFDQAHAVHITDKGWLMFFDNGAKQQNFQIIGFYAGQNFKNSTAGHKCKASPTLIYG